MKDPAGAPAVLTGLRSSPEEGEGWPPWHPVPGQGSAPPHYLLLQSLLHPSTPNRDYRPSTVSNCPDSGRGWTLVHTTQPWPPQLCPAVERDCLLLWGLGAGGARPGASRGTLPPPRVASGAREGSWSLAGETSTGLPGLLCLLFRPRVCSFCLSLSGCSSPHPQSTPGSSHQITQPQLPSPPPAF